MNDRAETTTLGPKESTSRLHNLDYLRGIAAFGIMIYHYFTWSVGALPADTFLGRVGLYGVSIFYALSGLTLFHVYFDKMTDLTTTRSFFIRRVFRIFPLLWLVTLAALVVSHEAPNIVDLLLNLTGLFGFLKWDAYFSPGVWSIGNELVFYVIFPLIVLCAKSRRFLIVVLGIILLAPYVYFAFVGLTEAKSLDAQWSMYINPLNQSFLFFGGFIVGLLMRRLRVPQLAVWTALVGAITVFVFWPTGPEPSALVTDWNRLVFTAVCLVICAGVYKLALSLPYALHVPLSRLGEASYSLYLLHPLVYGVVTFLLGKYLVVPVQIVVAIALALIVSWVTFRYFETFFVRLGQRVTRSRTQQRSLRAPQSDT